MEYLFVYGSLMFGMENNHILKKYGKFVSDANTIVKNFALYDDGDSPWLAVESQAGKLYGEVWTVTDLSYLDEFESECNRILASIHYRGTKINQDVYMYIPRENPPANLRKLRVANWKLYIASGKSEVALTE